MHNHVCVLKEQCYEFLVYSNFKGHAQLKWIFDCLKTHKHIRTEESKQRTFLCSMNSIPPSLLAEARGQRQNGMTGTGRGQAVANVYSSICCGKPDLMKITRPFNDMCPLHFWLSSVTVLHEHRHFDTITKILYALEEQRRPLFIKYKILPRSRNWQGDNAG